MGQGGHRGRSWHPATDHEVILSAVHSVLGWAELCAQRALHISWLNKRPLSLWVQLHIWMPQVLEVSKDPQHFSLFSNIQNNIPLSGCIRC